MHAASRYGRPVPQPDGERMRRLMAYNWPGNVRELRNVTDRCVLGIEDGFPPFGTPSDLAVRPLAETVEAFERSLIAEALRRNGGSLARACEDLRVPKTTLHDKIRKYGLAVQ
jgi:two-component system C4-dicarboxylate transport response regulator DctD